MLTYMATIEQLSAGGVVHKVKGVLGPRQMEVRKVYLSSIAVEWMRNVLPSLKTDGHNEGAVSPKQQAYQLLKDFTAGEDMFADGWGPKPMKPDDGKHGVWELRTADLRFFTWFCRKGVVVVYAVETKFNLLKNSSYGDYRNRLVLYREALDLDEPKVIYGGYEDVF